MNSQKRILLCGLLSVMLLPVLGSIAGCGDGAVHEDAKVTQQRINGVGQIQGIVDRSNGTYDSLNEYDKNGLIKLTGSEAAAKNVFAHFKPRGNKAPGVVGLPPSHGGRN